MNEVKRLEIILKSLKEGVDLCVFDFVNDTAIIKDGGIMFTCKVVFSGEMALFRDIVQKCENVLTLDDISENVPLALLDNVKFEG